MESHLPLQGSWGFVRAMMLLHKQATTRAILKTQDARTFMESSIAMRETQALAPSLGGDNQPGKHSEIEDSEWLDEHLLDVERDHILAKGK